MMMMVIPRRPEEEEKKKMAFHPPPYTLDEEIAYAWAMQPFSPRRGVHAALECWMQCENEGCGKWRRIPRIVGKVLEVGREAVEKQLVKDAGEGMIERKTTTTTTMKGGNDENAKETTEGREERDVRTTTETTLQQKLWTCKDVLDARYDSCEKPQELSDDAIDQLMADADEAAEKEIKTKSQKEEEKKKRAFEYNKRKRDEANEAKIQAGTHERLPNGHVRKIVERKEKVVKEPRVKKEKVYKEKLSLIHI